MSIPRSKSAPHVPDSAVKTKKDGQTKPKLPRHASAITLGSSTFTSPHAYPYHSPREHEPEEDPFSLAGFFPNGLGLAQKWRDNAWKWLRDTDEDETEEDVILPRTMSPVSEDEEWLPRTPGSMLTPVADTTTQATIEKEDKLGILSFDTLFQSSEVPDASEPIISPYIENSDPLDSEALHRTLCALREAHTSVVASTSDNWKKLGSDGLFCPGEGDGLAELDSDRHVPQGLRRLLDALPV